MKKIIFFILINFHCATYLENRRNDFLDIFTIGIEQGMYGSHIKILPVNLGFQFQKAKKFSEFRTTEFKKKIIPKKDLKRLETENPDKQETFFSDGRVVFSKKSVEKEESEVELKAEEETEEKMVYSTKFASINLKDREVVSYKPKNGFGLRGGNFSSYYSEQVVFSFLGGEAFYSGDFLSDENCKYISKNKMFELYKKFVFEEEAKGFVSYMSERDNLKSHELKYMKIFSDKPKERQKRQKEEAVSEFIEDFIKKESQGNPELVQQLESYRPNVKLKPDGYPKSYLYQLEMTLGIHYGFRLGFNAAEFLDFILGIVTIDILKDDFKKTKAPSESEKIEFLKSNFTSEQEKIDKLFENEKACRAVFKAYFK